MRVPRFRSLVAGASSGLSALVWNVSTAWASREAPAAATEAVRHVASWHIAAFAIAIVVTTALVHKFVPTHRRQIRSTALLFVGYLLAIGAGLAFRELGWNSHAEQSVWVAELLETFMTINLAVIVVVDLGLRLVRVAPATIVTDLVIGAAYLIAIFREMGRAHLNATGLVTTSAVVSGILSISLAPTIGNILGGVALQLDNSVREGDWVQLDANTQGKIKAIRWRHTVVETRNWDTIIVPNVTLLSGNIMILGKRTDQPVQRRYWIYFNIDFRFQPADVIAAVNEALQSSPIPNVAREPKAHCICFDFARDGRDSMGYYAVRYWLTDLALDDPTNSAVRERIYSALKRAGIPLAVPASTVFLSRDDHEHAQIKADRERARRIELLVNLDLFKHLTRDEIEHLADHLIYAPFARNEIMTQQGREAHWLYILSRGEAEIIYADANGVAKKVGSLHGPDIFGEMGVMTGDPRSATVTATTPCECYRLDKEAFRKILSERKEVAATITNVLVTRRDELRIAQGAMDAEQRNRRIEDARAKLLGQIQTFFGLN